MKRLLEALLVVAAIVATVFWSDIEELFAGTPNSSLSEQYQGGGSNYQNSSIKRLQEEWNSWYSKAENTAIQFVKNEGYGVQSIRHAGAVPAGYPGSPQYSFVVTTNNISSSGGLITISIGIKKDGNSFIVDYFKAYTM